MIGKQRVPVNCCAITYFGSNSIIFVLFMMCQTLCLVADGAKFWLHVPYRCVLKFEQFCGDAIIKVSEL
jgi:hypothetical protein